MARSVNKVTLVGNVGRDPEIQTTRSGAKVVNISLATNRRTTDENGGERTDWHRLTLWDGLAEITAEHVAKGDRIYIEGRLEYDSYEREGVRIPTADIHVREMVMLSPKASLPDHDGAELAGATAD